MLYPGSTYYLTLTPGFTGTTYTEYWTAWIDYNGDKVFDDDEMIAKGTTYGNTSLKKSFRVPTNATNEKIRMRVCMSWGSYAKSVGSFTSGEVEDYDIYISNKEYPKPNPKPDPKPDPKSWSYRIL